MKDSKIKQILVVAGESAVLVLITLAAVMPFSCKITEQGIKILGGDYTPPVLNSFCVKNESSLELEFSEKVSVSGSVVAQVVDDLFDSMEHSDTIELSPALERASGVYGSVPCSVSLDESGCVVTIILEQEMQVGQAYEFYTQVTDSVGNTLTLAVPFAGFNSRVPELLITEIQTESVSSQNKAEKAAGIYRNEFVELLVLKGGNLAGLELCSGYDGETKKYVFPAIEVQTGELLLVHMRNRGNGCISEEGDKLDQAFSSYTNDEVRDLWTSIEATTLGNKTDVIIIKNTADGRLLDAVMFRASNIEAWTKTMIDYSQLIDESGIYDSGDTENAFVTDGMTSTKTMSRVDAVQLRLQVLEGEELIFPIKSEPESWSISSEPTPGYL